MIPRKTVYSLYGLIDAVNEHKYLKYLLNLAIDSFSGEFTWRIPEQDRLDFGLYLLSLYRHKLEVIDDEIHEVTNDLTQRLESLSEDSKDKGKPPESGA